MFHRRVSFCPSPGTVPVPPEPLPGPYPRRPPDRTPWPTGTVYPPPGPYASPCGWAGGTHPTGMLSWSFNICLELPICTFQVDSKGLQGIVKELTLTGSLKQELMIPKDTSSKWNYLLVDMYSWLGYLGNQCYLLDDIKGHVLWVGLSQ